MAAGRFKTGSTLRGIIENTGWLFALRALRLAFALFVGIWLARYLGPSRFGHFNYALAFVALFGPLARLGLESIVVRDIVRFPESRGEILGTTFTLRLAAGFACFALAVAVVHFARPGDALTRSLVSIISIGMVFQAFDNIDVWFQSQVQSKYAVYAKGVALALANLAKMLLILAEAPLVAFAWVAVGEVVVGSIGLVVVYGGKGHRMAEWSMGVTRAKGLLQQSWPMALSGALAVIYLRIDQVMLGQMAGQVEVGVYSTAVRISEIWYFIPVAISASVLPALVHSRELGRRIYESRLQNLYDFLVAVSLLVSILLTFFGRTLVTFLFGEAYSRGGLILAVHIWAGLFVFMKEALGKSLIIEGKTKFLFISNGFGALANVALNLVLIPAYGGMGAAVATVISYAAAGYLACFVFPGTRSAGRMLSLALVVPVRLIWRLLRPGRIEGGHG